MCEIVAQRGMVSFKARFPVLQELFAKNHRGGPFGPPSGARVNALTMRLLVENEHTVISLTDTANITFSLSLIAPVIDASFLC